MKHELKSLVCAVSVGCGALCACAADLYFSIDDDTKKDWSYGPGWKANSGTPGVPPKTNDTVTLNSSYLNVAAGRVPLTIPEGVDATCHSLWIGSLAQADRRVVGLKVDGGSLAVRRRDDPEKADSWNVLTVGHEKDGYGLVDVARGRVSAKYFVVGRAGGGVVTNTAGFVCLTNWNARMVLGQEASATGRYVQTGGAIGGYSSDQLGSTAIAVGHGGHGVFELAGGVVSNRVALGSNKGGFGELAVSGGSLLGRLDVGTESGATGRAVVTGGELRDLVRVGVKGAGSLAFDAPGLKLHDLQIGVEKGGHGVVTNLQPIAGRDSGRTIYVGVYGEGHYHAKADASTSYVKISAGTNATSTMTIHDGATASVDTQVCVGGSIFPGLWKGQDAPSFPVPGHGELILKGGALRFTNAGASTANFFLGRTADTQADTWGVLRGHGSVLPAEAGKTNVRMAIGVGRVIADGAGEKRTLDLNAVVNVTNTVPTAADGASGWYAENRGCVLFPRTWYGSGTAFERCIGDAPYAAAPGLVNSLRFSIRQASQGNNYFRGGVYAPDRDDLHVAELPPNDGVAGCWKLGVFDALSGTGARAFTDVGLTFRYDAAKCPKRRRFSLWRHDGTVWTRVGRATRQDGEIPRIATEKPLAPVAQTFNVGIFAVTADKAGMTILFR